MERSCVISYNISSVEILDGKLSIRRSDARELLRALETILPEDCFLYDLLAKRGPDDEMLPIERFAWRGSGSGSSYEEVLPKVLAKVAGRADLVFCWEGGDSTTGLRVAGGVGTIKKVKRCLE